MRKDMRLFIILLAVAVCVCGCEGVDLTSGPTVGQTQCGTTYKVQIDYDRPFEMGFKSGKYWWVHPHASSSPKTQTGRAEITIELLRFDGLAGEEILCRLQRMGFRPATLPELLALGEVFPELQKEFPIVALGSTVVANGHRFSPELSYGPLNVFNIGYARFLRLFWHDDIVQTFRCRFAAIKI